MAGNGFVRVYGLHWLADEIDWKARNGVLAGRIGTNAGTLRVADFWA